MNEAVWFLLKMLIASLPFIALAVLSQKVNLSKVERSKQYLMPAITVLYSIVCMFLMHRINEWLLKLLDNLPRWVLDFANEEWIPEFIRSYIKDFGYSLRSFLHDLNLEFWIFFLANAVILLAYYLVKRVSISVLKRTVNTQGALFGSVAGKFYTFDELSNRWCLREEYLQPRGFLNVMYGASIGVSVCLMMASAYLYDGSWIRGIYYPAFSVLIVSELYFALGGLTREEMNGSISGEDDAASRTVNYTLVRKYLRSLFGDKLSAENSGLNNALAYSVNNNDVLREFQECADGDLNNLGKFYENLSESGFELDHNYLVSSADLLKGKSILFNNPFYRDLIPYVFYPMNHALLNHQKVLIVLGRHAIENDIEQWVQDGIQSVTNIPFLWRISLLSEIRAETDIGILSRSQILNTNVLDANEDFLNDVGFMVILEPSKLISTAQIGLNMIVKKCQHHRPRNIVYCMCDKNCDGLVDAMSHILLTSITEVSATEKYRGTSSYMCWDPDDEYLHHRIIPNIARYLGVGTELSFAALKNQVSTVKWYGGETFPVSDMRWIDKQYYYDLMKYADLPVSQDAMDACFVTSPNFWNAQIEPHNFITVEDEFFNVFEVLRDFSTRAKEQGFVNAITSRYLLKDYMTDNASIFETDPKAIPCIVADFVRSPRNVILRLLLMMSTKPTPECIIEKEFSLLGIPVFDLRSQLWHEIYKCYADLESIQALSEDYRAAVAASASIPIISDVSHGYSFNMEILQCSERFNAVTGSVETVWFIKDQDFIRQFVFELRSASYVTEDEEGGKNYFGSELIGHVFQKYVPGQFFTFAGKYYEMLSVTADGHMLVRRAADHITGRKYYRQMRTYRIHALADDKRIGSSRQISGLRVSRQNADYSVQTYGYYEMQQYNDMRTAKQVLFDAEGGLVPERRFRNKSILRITLPEHEDMLTDSVRRTITLLMNEVFRTLFAENQPFISAVTYQTPETEQAERDPLTYSICCDTDDDLRNSIFIVEDSQIDLGLTEAVERNLERIFDIITDYITWHRQKLRESLTVPPVTPPVRYSDFKQDTGEGENEEDKADDGKKPSLGKRIKKRIQKIRDWFRKKFGKKGGEPEENPEDQPVNPEDGTDVPQDGFDVPQDGTDVPQDGFDVPQDGFDVPQDGFDVPQDGFDVPQDGFDVPQDGFDVPQDGSDVPQDGFDVPQDGFDVPQDGFDVPQDGFDVPQDGIVVPQDGFDVPQDGFDVPQDGIVVPQDAFDVPQDGFDVPQDGFDIPQDGFAIPEDGFTAPEEEFIAPVEEPVAPTEEPAVPSEAPVVPQEVPEPAEEEDFLSFLEKYSMPEPFESDLGGIADEQNNPPQPQMPAPVELTSVSDDDIVSGWTDDGTRKPYHERYYTLYGFSSEPRGVDLNATLAYLQEIRTGDNPLRQARSKRKLAEYIASRIQKDEANIRYCDFCGAEILGVEFETLADGRDRCMSCSRTAIKTGEEFKEIYETVKHNLESFFGIRIQADVRVEMVNSWKLHKKLKKSFVPSKNPDPRVLGVAIKSKDGMSLLVENGSPRMASMLTIAHELTHIWQYVNWDAKQIRRKYGQELELQIYEGMAKWVEVQYAFLINEPIVGKRAEIETMQRADEYGFGFIRYRANYPLTTDVYIAGRTPFTDPKEPLDPTYCEPLDSMYIQPPELPQPIEDPTKDTDDGFGSDDPQNDLCKQAMKGNKDRSPDSVAYYAYSLLDESEQALYDRIYDALTQFTPVVEGLAELNIPKEKTGRVVQFVLHDHPEIFWYACSSTTFDVNADIALGLSLTYNMSEEDAKARQQEIDAAIQVFLASVDSEMSDFEIVLKVYENIIRLVDYDSIGLDRQQIKRARDEDAALEPDDLRSIYGVFVQKKAVCAGYAKATQYLLNRLGIECAYYCNEEHAWNIVKLEGDYYFLDTTWGDSSNTKPEKNTSQDISYDCFCITSEELARLKEHELDPEYPAPECTATKCNYFVRFGLLFESYEFEKVRDLVGSLVRNGTTSICFKTADVDVFNRMKDALITNHKMVEILQYVNLTAKKQVQTTFSYSTDEDRRLLKFFLKQK